MLGRSLSERLVLPSESATIRLTTRGAIRCLHEGSRGRPGLSVKWAKRAASYAVWNDTDLDVPCTRGHPRTHDLDGGTVTTRLPLRVEPLPGEWWRSYIVRVADIYGVQPLSVLERVHGIARVDRRHFRWSGIALSEAAARDAGGELRS